MDNTYEDKEINAVFTGAWESYCIKATFNFIKIEDVNKLDGVYWIYISILYIVFLIDLIVIVRIKNKS
ncbi:hypothetical protein [Anaerovorax odorimutans]|uniref:hypothetical protein n=1 Tax=Anaerovorax odorimutans TaxID=109327 RepID=UPI0003FD8E36|nr:hypothetical protein [Anaerovorax odorimutans]